MAILLAACNPSDDSAGGSSRSLEVTIPGVAQRNIIEGCPPDIFEDWFEKTYFNMQAFVDDAEVNARTANDDRRNEVDFVLDRLVSLRNAVNDVSTPTCVQDRHQQVVSNMQVIIDHFQLFANAEISAQELNERVSRDIEDLKLIIDTFLEEVEPLYQLDESSP